MTHDSAAGFADADGVISLFGLDPCPPPAGRYLMVDGIIHLLSATGGRCLQELTDRFDLARGM